MRAQRPFRFGVLGVTPRSGASDWLDAARRAEDLGFATFQLTDHLDATPMAPIPLLGGLAVATTRIGLGTLVLDNDFRNPAVLAKELATVQAMSGGRLEVGLGAGWMLDDYAVTGIAFDPPAIRLQRMWETVEALRAVFRGDRHSSRAGAHYRMSGVASVPPPVGDAAPSILIGGAQRRMLHLAGERADIVSVNWDVSRGTLTDDAVLSGGVDATDRKVAWVREGAGDRDPELHLTVYFFAVTASPRSSLEGLLAQRNLRTDPDLVLGSPHCLVGDVDEICEQLLAARDRWGFSYITVRDSVMEEAGPIVERLAGR